MIQGILLQDEPIAKYSENIFNPFLSFDELDFTYTFLTGGSNIEVSNSDEFKLGVLNAQKIRALNTSSATFNAGSSTNTAIKESGLHTVQFTAFKNDVNANIQMRLEVYINDVLTSNRTIEVQMRESEGFLDNNWNIYYQTFLANEGDVVSLGWYFECSEVDCITYLTGYKLERNNQNLFAPTIYNKPTYLNNKWQQRIDFDNDVSLTEDVATNFGFIGTSTKNYVGEDLVESTGNFAPKRLNDIFSVNANFLCKVPTGDNIHLDVQFIINGITYQGDTVYLFKPIGEFQYANLYFEYPVTQDFIDNGGIITLTARGASFEISKRKEVVKVISNY
jgi:hypothetical protein